MTTLPRKATLLQAKLVSWDNMNYAKIIGYAKTRAARLFEIFDQRKEVFVDLAEVFYPLALAGLQKEVTELGLYVDSLEDDDLSACGSPESAVRNGASGFHTNLTNPSQRWFSLGIQGEDGKEKSTLEGLEQLTEMCFWLMEDSGAYTEIHKLYKHLLVFGFGAMLVFMDTEKEPIIRTLRIGTYALDKGRGGRIDSLCRKFAMSADDLIEEFGEKRIPEDILEKWKNAPTDTTQYEVYNLIEPRGIGKIEEDINLDETFEAKSIYWLNGFDQDPRQGFLRVTGYTVNPVIAPRFDSELGDIYGRGRGIDALGLARCLNTMRWDILNIASNAAEPAMLASDELKAEQLKLGRGAVNYVAMGDQRGQMAYPILAQQPDTRHLEGERVKIEQELAGVFFINDFAAIAAQKDNPGVKTATEVEALQREGLERIGPVVTNLNRELLDPFVHAISSIAIEGGYFEIAEGSESLFTVLNVEYLSRVHLAQNNRQLGGIREFIMMSGEMAQINPQSLDNIDFDEVLRIVGKKLGIPTSILRDKNIVAEERKKRNQAQAEALQMERSAQMAKDVGGIHTKDTVAGKMIEQVEGGTNA